MLTTLGFLLPYYRINTNQYDPRSVVDKYEQSCKLHGYELKGRIVLELGVGITNSTCYELSARNCQMVYAFEPYAQFHSQTDRKLLVSISKHYAVNTETIAKRVRRIGNVSQIEHQMVDIVFSNSVLEHVLDPSGLFRTIKGYLSEKSIMIHFVDYRDHFFKYPYHFLLFSKKTWDRWLNPGDLHRWRLGDHYRILTDAGFKVSIDDQKRDPQSFSMIKNRISGDFNLDDPDIDVTECVIIAHPPARSRA